MFGKPFKSVCYSCSESQITHNLKITLSPEALTIVSEVLLNMSAQQSVSTDNSTLPMPKPTPTAVELNSLERPSPAPTLSKLPGESAFQAACRLGLTSDCPITGRTILPSLKQE